MFLRVICLRTDLRVLLGRQSVRYCGADLLDRLLADSSRIIYGPTALNVLPVRTFSENPSKAYGPAAQNGLLVRTFP